MALKILVMGASGQIGSELVLKLRSIYGKSNVIASDIKMPKSELSEDGIFEQHDCLEGDKTMDIVRRHKIKLIYNLPALLSFNAEKSPQDAFNINLIGLRNTLEVARIEKCAMFFPSTIGVFGDSTPKANTPQETITRPNTMYGVTKFAGELLCDYYHSRFNLDIRGVRFPGIISNKTMPGGGTTDYAIDIFYEAIKSKHFKSYIKAGTFLDMLYMPDAIKACIDIMEANPDKLTYRNSFNITSMSLDVETIAKEIKKHIADFDISYDIDPVRQAIAESWPDNIDDTAARKQWNWRPDYDLRSMTKDMLSKIELKLCH